MKKQNKMTFNPNKIKNNIKIIYNKMKKQNKMKFNLNIKQIL